MTYFYRKEKNFKNLYKNGSWFDKVFPLYAIPKALLQLVSFKTWQNIVLILSQKQKWHYFKVIKNYLQK